MKKKENAPIYKKSKEDIVFNIVCYSVFTILAFIFAYPLYYLLINTISSNDKVNLNEVILYPIGVHFKNYLDVFKLEKFASSMGVSFARTVVGTGLMLLVTSYTAYLFTRQEMWGRTVAYRFIIATMYFSAGMIPHYMNFKVLGMLNTFWIYIIPPSLSTYNLILMKTSMEAIPESLEESAELDGAGYFTRYFRIVLPLSKPILATTGLFSAVYQWNAVFDTKLYIFDSKLHTMQFVLYEYYNQVKAIQDMIQSGEIGITENTVSTLAIRLTMTAVTVIPVLCIYPFVQKFYLKGIMVGAVKG